MNRLRPDDLLPPALLFGIPIANVSMEEALRLIDMLVVEGRATGRSHQISTVNVDFLVNALTDSSVSTLLQRADVCLADGMPVVWAARLLGMPIHERVAGADLVPRLVERSQVTGNHVHFFGASPPIADAASRLLRARYPGARFSLQAAPVITDVSELDDELLDEIADADADILCVALGNPKQERFISLHRERLRTPVMIGVGGSLDLLVGARRRAPIWAQQVGIEWIVRAIQEPRRLGRRYLRDIGVFVPEISNAYATSVRRRRHPGARLQMSPDVVEVDWMTGTKPTTRDWRSAASALRGGSRLHISGTTAASIDMPSAAVLVGLCRVASRSGCAVTWDPSSAAILAEIGPFTEGGHGNVSTSG